MLVNTDCERVRAMVLDRYSGAARNDDARRNEATEVRQKCGGFCRVRGDIYRKRDVRAASRRELNDRAGCPANARRTRGTRDRSRRSPRLWC